MNQNKGERNTRLCPKRKLRRRESFVRVGVCVVEKFKILLKRLRYLHQHERNQQVVVLVWLLASFRTQNFVSLYRRAFNVQKIGNKRQAISRNRICCNVKNPSCQHTSETTTSSSTNRQTNGKQQQQNLEQHISPSCQHTLETTNNQNQQQTQVFVLCYFW